MQITKLDISKWVVAAAAVSTSELWITSRQTHLKLDAVSFFFQFCSAEISIELHFVPAQQQRFKYLLCCCAPIRQQKRNNSSACRGCTALASMNSTALYKFFFMWFGNALIKSLCFRYISNNSALLMVWDTDMTEAGSGSHTFTSVLSVFSSHCCFHSSPWEQHSDSLFFTHSYSPALPPLKFTAIVNLV